MMTPTYEWTSERVAEEFANDSVENYLIYLIHRATYKFAAEFVEGKDVIDFGCGTGFGTALVAKACHSVVGVDISDDAIRYARAKYSSDKLTFQVIDDVARNPVPFRSEAFDVVLSFQVIEHISQPRGYLNEIRRLLKPSGVLILATPDRETRLFRFQRPWNLFHVREYDAGSLTDTLSEFFPAVKLFHLGGTDRIVRRELRRTAMARWAALPATVPILPDSVRIRLLGILGHLKRLRRGSRDDARMPRRFDFGEDDVIIGPDVSPSLDLIAVASKGLPGRSQ